MNMTKDLEERLHSPILYANIYIQNKLLDFSIGE